MTHSDILNSLNWRYATKKFNPAKKVSDADLDFLLESQRMAPTSYGLQPWKTVIIKNQAIRQELRAKGGGQAQFTDSTALLVICARTDIDENHIKKYIDQTAFTRGIARENLAGFEQSLLSFIKNTTSQDLLIWAQNQAYLSLGFILYSASLIKVDACPMGGFDNKVFDNILDMKSQNLTSTVLCAIGYRDETDTMSTNKKVRFPSKDLFIQK